MSRVKNNQELNELEMLLIMIIGDMNYFAALLGAVLLFGWVQEITFGVVYVTIGKRKTVSATSDTVLVLIF